VGVSSAIVRARGVLQSSIGDSVVSVVSPGVQYAGVVRWDARDTWLHGRQEMHYKAAWMPRIFPDEKAIAVAGHNTRDRSGCDVLDFY
jgi:hypothetical protein